MIRHFCGAKLTPNQAAKHIVADLGVNWWVWDERSIIDLDVLTESERVKIDAQCKKQCDRLVEFFGILDLPKF